MTKNCNRLRGERPKAFWGALVGGAMNLIGSAISSKSQARAIRRQIEAQKEAARTQLELANNSNLASTLNSYATATRSYNDEDDYNLKYRLGGNKRLGSNRIYITDGGNATKIGNDTYLLRGGSHEQTNETGQTGIGINVGGNEVEAEGGEVAQKKNGALRIFSAQPILGNGMSPAQAILRGYNKDKVFNQQQAFKKRNGLKDDGSAKYGLGGDIKGIWNFIRSYRNPVDNIAALVTAYQKLNPNSNYNKQKGKFKGGTFRGAGAGGTWTNDYKSNKGFDNFNDAYDDAVEHNAKTFIFGNKRYNTLKENNPIREINNRAVGSWRDSVVTKDRTGYGKDFGPIKGGASLIPLITETYNPKRLRHRLGGGLTSKDRGSSKHPYPSVSSKDFAGGGRSYPIPTKADAVDALRLAVLHGRSDVRSKVYSKYPSLRPKAAFGDWVRTNRDDNALADLLYESGLFDRESWNTMLRDIHEFTGMGANPYNTDDNIDAVMAPAFTSSSSRMLSQLAKSPEASYTLKRVLGLPTKEMVRKRIAGDIAKRIGVTRAARQSSNFRNYNIARMQAANAEASFSPFTNQVRYAEGKPVLVNTNGYYTTAGNTISRNAKNMTSGANPFLYAPRTSDEVLEGLGRVISNAKQGAKNVGQKVGNKFKGTPGQKLSDAYYNLTPMQRAKLKGLTLAATLSIPADYFVESQNDRNKKAAPVQKSVVVPKQVNKTIPQYKGNTTKGNYQLHDGETRTINGIKYTRKGNAIINHKTNVAYIYDKNGNYTGKADYSKVGNFNQAFDAARAAGRSQFIYRAGKYNNYSTIKETNAKKERLNRIVGARRVAKALGGYSRPVEGMRRKLTWGDVTYPYRRNNNFDYWDIIDQEQKVNDKGGISPWTTSNKYDVKVPYAITKSTPTIPYISQVSTPTSKVTENKTIPTYIGNKSGMILRDADWYGLGADLVSSIGGSILGLGAYKNLDFDYNLPNFVEESPVALNTTYHNEAQKSNVERNRLNIRNSILRNTMSGSTAVGRMQGIDTNSLYQLNQLADEKTNKETELMNQNLLNEQQVRARNAAARNQYYNTVASIKNAAIQAKNEAELAKGQILSGSLQGIGNSFQNFISQGRQNYDDTQAMLMGVAASDYATPSRLLELGVDVGDDAALAGIYRSAMNIPNPGARPKREDYSDNTEYSYALTRWENQNKAYQRRNSYADLIKGRMSKKNLIKYGII